ncbi:MAG: aldehyde dehydrogenase family protein [Candidatus Acidiferrales bacterium]
MSVSSVEVGFVDSVDRATGKVVARIAATDPGDLPAHFERARVAQKAWAAKTARERCVLLRRLGRVVFERRAEIVAAISGETGKPRAEATFAEILLVLDTIEFVAKRAPGWLRPVRVPHHNFVMKAKSAWLEYEPYGVLAIIAPWNYPFSIPMLEIVAGLAAGNAVVLKPSEMTPGTGQLIGELVRAAGFPDGLLPVVQGGGELGAALIGSEAAGARPDKVFFTGSVETGRRVAEASARALIPSVLELGGKDAMIVLADANLEMASSAAVWGGMMNCGQACVSVERIYVEQPVAQRFAELCAEKAGKLRTGPPSDPRSDIGPMISSRQIAKVEDQISEAVGLGAQVVAGGQRRREAGSNFYEPTVVTGASHSMRLMTEETFGPVIAIEVVASSDEAIERANASKYGLSASVWTADAKRGRKIASRLAAGAVMVNDVASYFGITEAPHGGQRASGWGRSHSRLGVMETVQVKYIDVDRLPGIAKPWWFGYGESLANAADRYVEFSFAPSWSQRLRALMGKDNALRTIFRRKL